ncbi:MAG: alpha/beta fold hydrolase [Acidimicrobiia bacterium]|nr:alpha/beta fold hydrolase [Acidimicrobiia bacterium]
MTLSIETIGAGRRLVLSHGFTQNRRCWGRFAELLAERFEVVLVDAPGHGESGHEDADLVESARLLVEVGGDAIYIGYSMGGRVTLHAALAAPAAVQAMVLIGATAGIDDPHAREHRRIADAALSDSLLADGLPVFIDRWLASPLFSTLDATAACRAERLANRPEGLAASLRACGTGTQEPLWSRLGGLGAPALVCAGADDPKFTALARRLGTALPAATVAVIADAGHSVHLEQPDETATRVTEFVAAVSASSRRS